MICYMIIDYNKLDILLAELFSADKKYVVNISEMYNSVFKLDSPKNEVLPYVAELIGAGLAVYDLNSRSLLKITPFGREVHQAGGWTAYKRQKKQAEQREIELREKEVNATIESANSSKSSKVAAWVSAIFSCIALFIGVLQYYDNLKKDEAISKLNEKSATLDSLLKHQQQTIIDLTKIVHQRRSSKPAVK